MKVIITKEWLKENTYREDKKTIAINSSQAKILNIIVENNIGWIEQVLGSEIIKEDEILFRLLKNVNGKKNQQRIIDRYKNSLFEHKPKPDKYKQKRLNKIISLNKKRVKCLREYVKDQKEKICK